MENLITAYRIHLKNSINIIFPLQQPHQIKANQICRTIAYETYIRQY